ncbi:hypothetical protein ACFYZ8_26775 [Streptomyces sp. NPDC001668]|uniref:hypothetical protein n=1 Tax=unclassified Streptomyces TaxID=2593676 RepID=UPI00368072EF
MAADVTAAAAEAEFDVLTARLGIDVPADLKGGVLRGYQGLRAMAELLRGADARHGDPPGDDKPGDAKGTPRG